MILTANKYVNARIGKPFTDAPNPSYLKPGDQVTIKSKVIGEYINGNNKWILTSANDFYSEEGFQMTTDLKTLSLYAHLDTSTTIYDLGIDKLWEYTQGEKIKVIVLDSGYSQCPNISANVIKMSSVNDNGEDDIGHGSLMCSIIAGNGTDVIGLAPACSLISIKYKGKNQEKNTNWVDFLEAFKKIKEVVNKEEIFIVNCSSSVILLDNSNIVQLQNLINYYTVNYKIFFVCAVGNDYYDINDTNNIQIIPARLKNVFSVAGVDKNKKRLISSNYWNGIDLTCLGEVNSDYFKNKYPDYKNKGSSQACAFASGLLVLFLSKVAKNSSEININKVKKIITDCTLKTSLTNNNGHFDFVLDKQKILQTFNSLV